jgi:hypothetical protein
VSAEHVKMYQALATEYPLIQFWGMSHSWSIPAIGVELLRFNKLQNVVIRESTDPASPVWSGLAPQFHYDAKVPFVAWMKQEAAAENPAILCPAQFKIKIGPKSVRVTTCLQCQKCWTQADRTVGSYEH